MTGLSADDHAQIIQLHASFAMLLDDGDIDNWVDCFTPDGAMVADGPAQDRAGAPLVGARWQGAEQLRALGERHHAGSGGRTRHWNSLPLVAGDGEVATARSYLMIVWAGQDGIAGVRMTGTYFDRLGRSGGRWRFEERHMVADRPHIGEALNAAGTEVASPPLVTDSQREQEHA